MLVHDVALGESLTLDTSEILVCGRFNTRRHK